MKTKELRQFYKTLSELNNSFTHYSFVWSQFTIDYSEILKNHRNEFTKDYFKSNILSKKHNIVLDKLNEEHEKTDKSLKEGIYLLVYSHFESYLKKVFAFSRLVDKTIIDLENNLDKNINDSQLIDKILNRIEIDKNVIVSELLISLDYLRLKRNRLTHRNSENISKSLNDIIKEKGNQLNSYWNKQFRKKLQGIDFTSKGNANRVNFDILIDLINIFRKISHSIDTEVINKLAKEKILVEIIIPEFKNTIGNKIKNYDKERINNKLEKYCDSEYCLTITEDMQNIIYGSIA